MDGDVSSVLTAATGLNLNDGVRYSLVDIDLGPANREESWIESGWSDAPVLSQKVNRRSVVIITLKVTGHLVAGDAATYAHLMANVDAVVAAFGAQTNTLTWGIDSTVQKSFVTYPSAIAPVQYDDHAVAEKQSFVIPRWTFSLNRGPNYTDGSPVVR